MKNINPDEAGSWSPEELASNIRYLEDRPWLWKTLDRVREAVASGVKPEANSDISRLSKTELLSLAEQQGANVDESNTKAEIIEALNA